MNKDYRWLLIGPDHPGGPEALDVPQATAPADEKVRLFARGHESIRIAIRAGTRTLHVCGPGRVQKLHEFPSAAELEQFLQTYEKSVVESGWTLLEVSDRRIAGRS
jgi:hypothetical protein